MTREEAKTFLLQFNTDKRLNISEHEAVRVAISALEQNERAEEWYKLFVEKFESCEDTISREAALNTINAMRVACDTNDIADYYILLLEAFKELPSVTPSRRKRKDRKSVLSNATLRILRQR